MTRKPDVLFTGDEIRTRVAEVGAQVAQAFDGTAPVCVVGVMKNCMVFMADLIRHIPADMTCHFLRVTSLPDAKSVRNDIVYSTEIPYEGQHILLLQDIIDTGITLSFLREHILEKKPKTLKVCTLVDKPQERKIDVHPDWAVFTVQEHADRFIVGYGLDHDEQYRGLPYLGTIPRPTPASEERTVPLRLES
jgi:hypoxanthine phosphoribosyltransferase